MGAKKENASKLKPLGPRIRVSDKIETAFDHNTGNIIWYFDGKEGHQVKALFKKN